VIASVTGILVHKSPRYLIVDVHGIGYQVFTSLQSFYQLPEPKESVTLHTYTHLREDTLQLYGFLTPVEREVFILLMGVSGIGPKSALNILSGLSVEELVRAVREGNLHKLTSVPGIGAKTAGRMALELKDKVAGLMVDAEGAESRSSPDAQQRHMVEDAVSALVNLGYHHNQAKEAVKRVCDEGGIHLTMEEVIRTSLKRLSR
jgi:Holliday junction DNA helicase RuvA